MREVTFYLLLLFESIGFWDIAETSLSQWETFEESCESFVEQVKKYEKELKHNAELKTALEEKYNAIKQNKV